MGLLVVKAIKPAAGDQFILGSQYALTPMGVGVIGEGVPLFFSYVTTAGMNVAVDDTGEPVQLFGVVDAIEMNVLARDDSTVAQLNGISDAIEMNVLARDESTVAQLNGVVESNLMNISVIGS